MKDRKRTSLEVLSQIRCEPGDSVAVNGACLTIVPNRTPGVLRFDVSHETWRLTNLGSLEPGHRGSGPALIEDSYLTCRVEPGWSFAIDNNNNVVLQDTGGA